MGIIHSGIPKQLVSEILKIYPIENFVETGTYNGETASWAAGHFKHVFTIEMAEILWKGSKKRFAHLENIDFLLGDSRKILGQLIETISGPTIYWLDAHWSGDVTYGENDECPLLKEIETINHAKFNHFILIDDARLFLAPPPKPHNINDWPDISSILKVLNVQNRYVAIVDDVIVAIPIEAKPRMVEFLQACSENSWNLILQSLVKAHPTSSKIKAKIHELINNVFVRKIKSNGR